MEGLSTMGPLGVMVLERVTMRDASASTVGKADTSLMAENLGTMKPARCSLSK